MNILTENNTVFSMDNVPSVVDDIRYCVLDYSNQDLVDYFCIPLVFLETFLSPSADIQIGEFRVQIPLDWSIIIGERDMGDLEIIPITHCLDKDFMAFCFNPLAGYRPAFEPVDIVNVYPDVKWHVPKLKNGHILSIPLSRGKNSLCCFIAKDIQKIPDSLDISKMI